MELKQEKKPENINIEEFKALVNNLIPTTLKQASGYEVERLIHEHPELKEKFKEWHTMPESEKKETRRDHTPHPCRGGDDTSKIGEMPIVFENRKKGKSKLTLKEISAFFKYILKVSWEQLLEREH